MDQSATKAMIECGVSGMGLAGQPESGDLHIVKLFPDGCLIGVVDGLGHGPEAAVAARIAVRTLEDFPTQSPISLVKNCHEQLIGTRGVVMSIASINFMDNTLTWIGVGNVEGIVWRADSRSRPLKERILTRSGVVGYQLPRLQEKVLSVTAGDVVIFVTDGIGNEFAEKINIQESPQAIADGIFSRHAKGTDDALVLVTKYKGGHL